MALPLRFANLTDDIVTEILSRLPNEELFRIETVSKSVQRSVRRVLNRVEAIAFQHSQLPPSPTVTCDHFSPVDDLKTISVFGDRSPLTSVVYFLFRCPEVKCLDLRLVDNIDNIILIVSAFPQLECLYLGIVNSHRRKWMSFVDLVSRRLRHLSVEENWSNDRLEALIKACRCLERCHLECRPKTMDKLMSLKCLKPEQTVLSLKAVRRVWNVSYKIEGLTASMSTLKAIAERNDNKLDQLRQLTVSYRRSEDSEGDIPPIQFTALETLKIFPLKSAHLLQLAEFRFPNLRTLHLKAYYVAEDVFEQLLKQTKNVKRLILDNLNSDFRLYKILGQSLATLTQLETVDVFLEISEDYLSVIGMVKTLAKIKTIKKVRLFLKIKNIERFNFNKINFDDVAPNASGQTLNQSLVVDVFFKITELLSVIAVVETMAKMKTVKKVRMRLEFESLISISKKEMKELASGVGKLKKWADTVKIELVYRIELKKKVKRQLDDWIRTFGLQPEVKQIQQRQENENNLFEKDSLSKDKLIIWL